MKELKVLKVFNTLTPSEKKRFEKFINSPYFNVNDELIKVFSYLFRQKAEILNKESLWKNIFPTIPYKDAQWRKYCHDLILLFQEFLVAEKIKNDPLIFSNLLLESIDSRTLNPLKESGIALAASHFKSRMQASSEFYLKKFQFEKNLYDLHDYDLNTDQASNLGALHQALDLFYHAEKIKQLVNVITRQKLSKHAIAINMEDEVISAIQNYQLQSHPEINIYYKLYLLKKNDQSDDHFIDLKKDFYHSVLDFPAQEANYIVKEILNYLIINKYNQGEYKYLGDTFDLYKFALKHDIMFPDKIIPQGDFFNIVTFGIRNKEFKWVENFIQEFQHLLDIKVRLSVVTFAKARLHFNQKKFNETILLLRDVEMLDMDDNLNSKVLLLATYYEVAEWPVLASLTDSFRTFLNRHEKDITLAKRKRYSNFIKFVKRLSRVKYEDKKSKQHLKAEIENSDGVVNQAWLLEKIKEVLP